MRRINTPDGNWQPGDPSTGIKGTIVTRDYMQSQQEELAAVPESVGIKLDPNDNQQILKGIRKIYADGIAGGIQTGGRVNGVNSPNLLFNGSGEFGLAGGWGPGGFIGAYTSSTGDGTYFSNSAAINANSYAGSAPVAMAAGVKLTLSGEINTNGITAGIAWFRLVCLDASSSVITTSPNITTTNGAYWTFVSGSMTMPPKTAYVYVQLGIEGSPPAVSLGGVVWRRIKLEQGSSPSLYSQEADLQRVALLDSPALTGTPTAPTPDAKDNSTRLATTDFVRRASGGVVGDVRNARMHVEAASASANFTADEIVVETTFGGGFFRLAGFNKTINLATTGAGGMDAGTAPANGYVALYAVYNPVTKATALLATNATATRVPEIYGGANMPPDYTASALVSVWPTDGSGQLVVGYQIDRVFYAVQRAFFTTSTAVSSMTALNISSVVPPNARKFSGVAVAGSTNPTSPLGSSQSGSSLNIGSQNIQAGPYSGAGQSNGNFSVPLITSQTMYYTFITGGGASPLLIFYNTSYEF